MTMWLEECWYKPVWEREWESVVQHEGREMTMCLEERWYKPVWEREWASVVQHEGRRGNDNVLRRVLVQTSTG